MMFLERSNVFFAAISNVQIKLLPRFVTRSYKIKTDIYVCDTFTNNSFISNCWQWLAWPKGSFNTSAFAGDR